MEQSLVLGKSDMNNNEIISAMKQAVDWIESTSAYLPISYDANGIKLCTSLRQAIARAEGTLEAEKQSIECVEPVADRFQLYNHIVIKLAEAGCKLSEQQKMVLCSLKEVTHPQPAPPKREPLLVFAQECVLGAYRESELAAAAHRAIKAAHGIKGEE